MSQKICMHGIGDVFHAYLLQASVYPYKIDLPFNSLYRYSRL